MADIANLQFRADTGDIKDANQELDKLAQSARKVESAADGARDAIRRMGQNGGGGVKQTTQDVEALLNKLNPTSKAFDELDKSMQQLQSARSQKLINAEQFSDFSAIIDRQRSALQKSYDDLTGYSDRVRETAAAEKAAAAGREQSIASLNRLRGVLDPAAEAARRLKEQYEVLDTAKTNGLLDEKTYVNLKGRLDQLSSSADKSSMSAGRLQAGWSNATQQFIDLGVQLQGGANPITALIQQGPQLAYSFGSVGNTLDAFKQQFAEVAKNFGFGADSIEEQAGDVTDSVANISESLNNTVDASKNVAAGFARFITPLTLGITALVAGVAYLGYTAYKSATEMDTFQKAINSTGNIAGTTARNLSDLADAVAESTDSSRSSAAQAVAIAASFASSTEQIKQFTEAALVLSESTGQGVEEILNQFKRLSGDPVQALVALNDQYNFADKALYDHVKALTETGDKTQAMTLIVDSLEQATKHLTETTESGISNSTGFWDNLAYSIKKAYDNLGDYQDAFKQFNPNGTKTGSAVFDTIQAGQQTDAKSYAENWKNISERAASALGFVTDVGAEQRKLNKEQIAATAEIDRLTESTRTNAQIRNEETARFNKLLQEGKINQEQYNKAVDALNAKYQDPKTAKERQRKTTTSVDSGDRLTEQYAAQNLALDAQIKLLQNRSAYETNASQQRKDYLLLEAKYTVLEQAAADRKLTTQEKQMLAVKDEALAQAKMLADKGDQLATLQRQAQVQDEIVKLQNTQTLQAKVYADNQGVSTKQLERQLELAQTRAAVLAKGGTSDQVDAAEQIKKIDFDQADARAADWIDGMKTGLADWADAATNYAKIASDAVSKGMDTATSAVSNFVTTGKFDFADFTKSILKMIVDIISQLLVMNALKSAASATGFAGLFANAKGGVYDDPSLSRYSNGVYDSPQMFSFGGRSQFAKGGVFAEAGPEAIMPLSRDANGKLGVKAEGVGGSGVSVQQTVVVNADGSAKSSTTSNDAVGRAVGDQLNAAVVDQVAKMMRPGGILSRAYGSGRG